MLTVKVYNRTNTTLKETLKGSLLLGDIVFTANVNGGQGELTLQINKPLTTTDYALGDIIKIKRYDEQTKDGVDLYMGYVTKIGRKQTTSRQYIELSCLGVASLLSEHNTAIAYNSDTLGDIVKSFIDDMNTAYGGTIITYDSGSIPDGPGMGSGNISESNVADAITTITTAKGYKRYVDGAGKFFMFKKADTDTHFLTNQKDVESIDIQEEIQEMVNKIYIWSKFDVSQTSSYSDATSISLYGTKYYSSEVDIFGQDALDDYAEQYVEDRKDPKKQTTLVVNREYAIETIKPGDKVKVRNFEYAFADIPIEKLQYTQDKCILYLDQYISFGKQIKSLANG